MSPQSIAIADTDALFAAVANSMPGTVIVLAAGEFRFARSLRIEIRLTLRGPEAIPARLIFSGPDACLEVAATGCALEHLVVASERHRIAPLVSISVASNVRVSHVALVNSDGRGLEVTGCHGLELTDIAAAELGAEALIATACTGARISAICRGVGRAHRASAVVLDGCSDFRLTLDVADTSGSAVTIRGSGRPARAGILVLHAEDCLRGLTVIGQRDDPLTGLSGNMQLRNCIECGAMLTNVDGLELDIAIEAAAAPALRLTGAYGARGCTIVLECGMEVGALLQDGGSAGNRITRRVRGSDSVPITRPCVPTPPIAALITEASEDGFTRYQIAATCSLCGWSGMFRRTVKSERETLACEQCRAVLRYRGQAEALLQIIDGGRHATLAALAASGALTPLAIFEPGVTGPMRPYLSQAGIYHGSTYIPGVASGTMRDGIACQDLMATSFPDASFDLVVTSDIMEHIRKPMVALQEICRILRPGGAHVFSIPFAIPVPERTRARVDTSGPEDRHLVPPIYHGSGSGGLSLVYTDFGRDLGVLLRGIGMSLEVRRHSVRTEDDVLAATMIARRNHSA